MIFSTPVQKAFIKGIPSPNAKESQLTALQKAGSIGFNYRATSDNPIKVDLDVLVRQSETNEHVIAEYPIEDGTFLIDNIVKSPIEVELETIITDTPVNIINPIGGLIDTYKGRSTDVLNDLKKIKNNNITVTIVTGLEIYKNMYLRSMTVRRDNNTGFAVNVSMSFKEQRTVKKAGATSVSNTTDDVRHTIGVGDAIGLLTLLPLVV
jgi:hypothetical protein